MEDKNRTTLVIGATGLVGKELVNFLLKDDSFSKVVLFLRKPLDLNNPKLIQHKINFDEINSYSGLFNGNSLFCCLGTTIKKAGSQKQFRKVDFDYPLEAAKICLENKVKQFLLVSSIGANPDSKIFYSRVKGEIEKEIIKLNFDETYVFRPSILAGKRDEKRPGEKTGIFFANLLSQIGIKKYKPISAGTLAEAMIKISKTGNEKFRIFESNEIQLINHN